MDRREGGRGESGERKEEGRMGAGREGGRAGGREGGREEERVRERRMES